ncbi:MAG: hypothetical protein U9R60_06570 [Bacteroidota bacterium]|nr:hypothetical protein [Bacteroidota bacterium]
MSDKDKEFQSMFHVPTMLVHGTRNIVHGKSIILSLALNQGEKGLSGKEEIRVILTTSGRKDLHQVVPP